MQRILRFYFEPGLRQETLPGDSSLDSKSSSAPASRVAHIKSAVLLANSRMIFHENKETEQQGESNKPRKLTKKALFHLASTSAMRLLSCGLKFIVNFLELFIHALAGVDGIRR